MTEQPLHSPPFPWQAKVWSSFVRDVLSERLAHAVLLTASEGLGIDKLALAMGQFLLCDQVQVEPVNAICRECKSCRLLAVGNHPGLLHIEAQSTSGQLLVDQIREINEFVTHTLSQGGARVVIIQTAHTMNTNAANALLKNLEEPSGRTFFILVSSQPGKLLPTVRSRCRKMSVFKPPMEEAKAWLVNQGLEDVEAYLEAAEGSPLKALAGFREGTLETHRQLGKSLQALLEGKSSSFDVVKTWASADSEEVVNAAMHWVEHTIRREMLDFRRQNGAFTGILFRFRDRLCQKRALLRSSANVNALLILEEIACDAHVLGRALGKI